MVNRSATTPKAASLSIVIDIDRECPEPGAFARQRAEAVGSERDAREQVAEHRADAEPEEQRRDDARRRQEQQGLLV